MHRRGIGATPLGLQIDMRSHSLGHFSEQVREFSTRRAAEAAGALMLTLSGATTLALVSWSAHDPSLNHATGGHVRNLLGHPGAVVSDLLMQLVGFGAIAAVVPLAAQGVRMMKRRRIERASLRLGLWIVGIFASAATASLLPPPTAGRCRRGSAAWPATPYWPCRARSLPAPAP